MARITFHWSSNALSALRTIHDRIAPEMGKRHAKQYIARIRTTARSLKQFPQRGWVVAEFDDLTIREILHQAYRIIYRYRENQVIIMTVFHSSGFLRKEHLGE